VTTAFVLSGGASLGAIQVGMLQSLFAAGIEPDLLLGTSVGALNAGYIAGHPGPAGADALAEIWQSLRSTRVFPITPAMGLRGLVGRANHLVSPDALRALVREHVGFARLEESVIPFQVVVADARSGEEVVLSSGDSVEAIVASAAIPGIFPPVTIDGVELMDGGVADNTPISNAVELGADVVYVLPTGHTCGALDPPRSALGMVMHAITILIGQQLVRDIEHYGDQIELHVVPPLCPLTVFPMDFRHARELISRGRDSTTAWLEASRPVSHSLGRHGHETSP